MKRSKTPTATAPAAEVQLAEKPLEQRSGRSVILKSGQRSVQGFGTAKHSRSCRDDQAEKLRADRAWKSWR
jgi:hypothetical protein